MEDITNITEPPDPPKKAGDRKRPHRSRITDKSMHRRAIIATDHKTGTVWMRRTFRAICARTDVPFERFRKDDDHSAADIEPPAIIQDSHSRWYGKTKPRQRRPDDRVLHVIRDPRDVIISAAHYHCTSKEKWLHVASETFGGLTYQQKINSLPDHRARYLFEMENSAANVIRRMRKWNYERTESFECKYEALMEDTEGQLFAKIAAHLGFSGPHVEISKAIFLRRAIFAGRAPATGIAKHVRSGAPRQWISIFDQNLARVFVERFGDALITLDYEPDNSWVERLPVSVAALDSSGARISEVLSSA